MEMLLQRPALGPWDRQPRLCVRSAYFIGTSHASSYTGSVAFVTRRAVVVNGTQTDASGGVGDLSLPGRGLDRQSLSNGEGIVEAASVVSPTR
jgi:hypothetical protein